MYHPLRAFWWKIYIGRYEGTVSNFRHFSDVVNYIWGPSSNEWDRFIGCVLQCCDFFWFPRGLYINVNCLGVSAFSIVEVANVTIFFKVVEHLCLFRLFCRLKDVFIVISCARYFTDLVTAVELVLFFAASRAAVRVVSFILDVCCVLKVA